MTQANDNKMKIWVDLTPTDPKAKKNVSFGKRTFTAIDAMWQVKRMTEYFGKVGEGWGWTLQHTATLETSDDQGRAIVIEKAFVSIWTGDRSHEYGGHAGSAKSVYYSNDGKFMCDDDACKKAVTDALTKGLSHLGLSSDIFAEAFTDNKYAQEPPESAADASKGTSASTTTATPDFSFPADYIAPEGDMGDFKGMERGKIGKSISDFLKTVASYDESDEEKLKLFKKDKAKQLARALMTEHKDLIPPYKERIRGLFDPNFIMDMFGV